MCNMGCLYRGQRSFYAMFFQLSQVLRRRLDFLGDSTLVVRKSKEMGCRFCWQ
ncbi:hypothetical protein BDV29DRAFT_174629 [Aspergillus leporis]|uniref:Uncharacterized protein n=1 Tax=Aspergillus leporis TaxID=41062 RepID=A0A5N5X3H9_9EURO|nr:hypothetical protein BDV29DRAFT_174629 [Aspergillus leporis]